MKSIIIIITSIVLGAIVILLAYFGLYANITNEIHVRKVMDERAKENIQRLKDLRESEGGLREEKDARLYRRDLEILKIARGLKKGVFRGSELFRGFEG